MHNPWLKPTRSGVARGRRCFSAFYPPRGLSASSHPAAQLKRWTSLFEGLELGL